MKLNLGAGRKWKQSGWTNYDKHGCGGNTDVIADFMSNNYEFPRSRSVEKIFISHMLEHLTTPAVKKLLTKCRKALAKNGIIRIISPDFDRALIAYARRERRTFFFNPKIAEEICLEGGSVCYRFLCFIARYQHNEYTGGPPIEQSEVDNKIKSLSPEKFIKWVVGQIPDDAEVVDHRNAFNYDMMRKLLEQAGFGFSDIYECENQASNDVEMSGQQFKSRPHISFVMEART